MRLIATLFLTLLIASAAHADDDNWGCTVLLCLANPAGPMAVTECVPPIQRLFAHLAKGGSMPSCQGSGTSRATAQGSSQYWCPTGYLMAHPDIKDAYFCMMAGSIDVEIDGKPWSRTWWGLVSDPGGRNSVTLNAQEHFMVPLQGLLDQRK